MSRSLDKVTLNSAAEHYAALFTRDAGKYDAAFVMTQFFNFKYMDEFEFMISAVSSNLGKAKLADFKERVETLKINKPRDPLTFAQILAGNLAINIDGEHIDGQIGSVQIDTRVVGTRVVEVETPASIKFRRALKEAGAKAIPERKTELRKVPAYWPIYAGEHEERLSDSGIADPLPVDTQGMPVGANVPRLSNALAIAMADEITLKIDEGTLAGIIGCYSGAQPAGVDVAPSGVLLATLTFSDPAFPAATDGAPGGLATANAITDDSSADATGTLGYNRASSSSVALTILASHFDGEAGTAAADYIWNTLAFVAGAVISMSALTLNVSEG